MSKVIGDNINKSLSGIYSQKTLDQAKSCTTDPIQTS